jgi:hypothetical protein
VGIVGKQIRIGPPIAGRQERAAGLGGVGWH